MSVPDIASNKNYGEHFEETDHKIDSSNSSKSSQIVYNDRTHNKYRAQKENVDPSVEYIEMTELTRWIHTVHEDNTNVNQFVCIDRYELLLKIFTSYCQKDVKLGTLLFHSTRKSIWKLVWNWIYFVQKFNEKIS